MTQPGRRVPQVMGMTMIIGLLTCFPLFLTLMFFIKDMDAVMNSILPSMELVYQVYVSAVQRSKDHQVNTP